MLNYDGSFIIEERWGGSTLPSAISGQALSDIQAEVPSRAGLAGLLIPIPALTCWAI